MVNLDYIIYVFIDNVGHDVFYFMFSLLFIHALIYSVYKIGT